MIGINPVILVVERARAKPFLSDWEFSSWLSRSSLIFSAEVERVRQILLATVLVGAAFEEGMTCCRERIVEKRVPALVRQGGI